MASNIVFALGVVMGLLGAAFVGRRFAGSNWQRNAFSVAMVVLGLLAAFLLFFSAGLYMHRVQAQGDPQADAPVPTSLVAHARLQAPAFGGALSA